MNIQAARILIKSSKYNDAIELIDRLSEQEKNSKEALFIRGCAHQATGNIRAAEKDWQNAIKQDGNDPALLSNLGRLYYDEKKYRNAAKYFSLLANSGHASHESWYYLAECLLNLNLVDQGCKAIGQYLKASNLNEEAFNKACRLLQEYHKDKELALLSAKAANIFTNTATFAIYQAKAYIKLSLYENAEKCLLGNPSAQKTVTGSLYMAICRLRLNDYRGSEKYITQILSKDPNHMTGNILLGQLNYLQGNCERALATWNRTLNIRQNNQHPETFFWLAKYYYENTNESKKAIDFISKEIRITEGAREESHCILITSLLTISDLKGAKKAFSVAKFRFPCSMQIESLRSYVEESSQIN